jgi:hypothetical protein
MTVSGKTSCKRCDDLTDDPQHVCERCRRKCVEEFDQKSARGLHEPFPLTPEPTPKEDR